ncbi:MAG: DUF4386 domain-containing protein [Actinomycetota bacterium]|nr:DUF4386 domain-containing protein [Actinomycetota bacterium]
MAATPLLVAVRGRVRAGAPGLVDWGVLLAVAGAFGSAVHGAYDLANAVHPPAALATGLPNPVDPRGFLTFVVAGIGMLLLGTVIARTRALPRWLGYLGCLRGNPVHPRKRGSGRSPPTTSCKTPRSDRAGTTGRRGCDPGVGHHGVLQQIGVVAT